MRNLVANWTPWVGLRVKTENEKAGFNSTLGMAERLREQVETEARHVDEENYNCVK